MCLEVRFCFVWGDGGGGSLKEFSSSLPAHFVIVGCGILWPYRKIPTFRENIVAPSSLFSQGDSLSRQAVGVSEDTMSNFSVALVTVACSVLSHRHGVELVDGSIYLLTLIVSCMVVTLSSAYVAACLYRVLTEYMIF